MEKETYQQPAIEVTEVRLERGFAQSDVEAKVESFDREEWNE